MASGTLQLHPSARCNLRCHHCYSSSGPDRADALSNELLTDVIDDAAAIGYGALAVSGGEPLMYRGLEQLLRRGRAAGMRTLVTTNGTLATPARLERLAPWLDVLAFSLDGPPEVHNAVRGVPWAFERLVKGLSAASALGIPHGVLYTATASSWPYVEWASKLAESHGCALFQVHAISDVGRARAEMQDELLGDVLDYAYVAASMVRNAQQGGMKVHLDLLRRSELEAMSVQDAGAGGERRPPVLVVEEDGVVVPFAHGFSRAGMVADLRDTRLRDAWPAFARDVYPALVRFAEATRARLLASDRRVFDWYAELGATPVPDAGRPASVPVAVTGSRSRT